MGQLVKKTAAAVAVDDSLTTLLDWTNIETLADFTIVIENAGGGSANDITDIQIDTSDDAGVTPSLDQHAGVPAVPVADSNSSTGTFTESSAYIRVRALCAADEDTTANAYLLADSSTVRICTLADVKERLAITDKTDYDSMLNRIILGLETIFDAFCRRTLIVPAADVTEYLTGSGARLLLARYPIVSITSVKEATDYDFTNATALTADTDYRQVASGKNGILFRMYNRWSQTEDSVQVIYRGGYAAAGQTPGTGETALPADIREAAIEQTCFVFKRRDDLGLSAISGEGGGIQKFSAMKLLPMVQEILKPYKQPML